MTAGTRAARGALACAVMTAVAISAGCVSPRVPPPAATLVTWQNDVAPVLAARCQPCHAGPAPAGHYDLTSYLGALGDGSDRVPNAVAGDADSLLLRAVAPGSADATHASLSDLEPLLRAWVVNSNLALRKPIVHEIGVMNPNDDNFHGVLLQRDSWNFGLCQSCHGDDFSGGKSGVSCLGCHKDGPTSCDTCHADIAEDGAHGVHLGENPLGKSFECSACHIKPQRYDDPGHIFNADGSVISSPAKVVFGNLARNPDPSAPAPSFDPKTGACANVYCHEPDPSDTNADNTTPSWQSNTPPGGCDSCHGAPPSSHAEDQCGECHPTVARDDLTLVDPKLHIDGVVEVGDGSGGCSECHGSAASPAPPRDLEGHTATTFIGVGAHRSHLFGTHRLMGTIPCSSCHLVPAKLHSPGHIDSPGPAQVTFSGVAAAGGASPSWDHATATCSGVYCHGGGGGLMSTDTASGLNRTPVWTDVGNGEAACGACHGIPPRDGVHDPSLTLRQCASCHSGTVDAFGNIIVTGPPGARTSEHIDGTVEVD